MAAVPGLWWKAVLLGVAVVGMIGLQCWALLARRPRLLVPGVALGTAVLLSLGVWVQNEWVNRTQDFPQLATLVERHAKGGDAGVLGGRFFSVDVYLGRPLTPVRTQPLFLAFVARPDRPVVLLSERVWNEFTDDVRSRIEVLERLRVRRQLMLIVRAREPGGDTDDGPGAAGHRTMTELLRGAPRVVSVGPRSLRPGAGAARRAGGPAGVVATGGRRSATGRHARPAGRARRGDRARQRRGAGPAGRAASRDWWTAGRPGRRSSCPSAWCCTRGRRSSGRACASRCRPPCCAPSATRTGPPTTTPRAGSSRTGTFGWSRVITGARSAR